MAKKASEREPADSSFLNDRVPDSDDSSFLLRSDPGPDLSALEFPQDYPLTPDKKDKIRVDAWYISLIVGVLGVLAVKNGIETHNGGEIFSGVLLDTGVAMVQANKYRRLRQSES